MKKRLVISALLIALSLQVFAQENNIMSIGDYLSTLNNSIDTCREEYNDWLVVLDNRIETAKESILSEEDKQYYINIFDGYKNDIRKQLIVLDEFGKKTDKLTELCSKPLSFLSVSKSTKIDITIQEIDILIDSLQFTDKRLRIVIPSTIETFDLDLQWQELFASLNK